MAAVTSIVEFHKKHVKIRKNEEQENREQTHPYVHLRNTNTSINQSKMLSKITAMFRGSKVTDQFEGSGASQCYKPGRDNTFRRTVPTGRVECLVKHKHSLLRMRKEYVFEFKLLESADWVIAYAQFVCAVPEQNTTKMILEFQRYVIARNALIAHFARFKHRERKVCIVPGSLEREMKRQTLEGIRGDDKGHTVPYKTYWYDATRTSGKIQLKASVNLPDNGLLTYDAVLYNKDGCRQVGLTFPAMTNAKAVRDDVAKRFERFALATLTCVKADRNGSNTDLTKPGAEYVKACEDVGIAVKVY